MPNDLMSHQVAPDRTSSPHAHQVPPGGIHVNQVHLDSGQVLRHRHKEWSHVPLCDWCLKHHVWSYLVRYPVAATADEVCCCPCREVKA